MGLTNPQSEKSVFRLVHKIVQNDYKHHRVCLSVGPKEATVSSLDGFLLNFMWTIFLQQSLDQIQARLQYKR